MDVCDLTHIEAIIRGIAIIAIITTAPTEMPTMAEVVRTVDLGKGIYNKICT